jgi:hypothetical protein
MSTAVEKPKEPSTPLGRFGRATVNPVNIGIAAAAATLAIGLGSLPIGIIGGFAYLAMVAWDSVSGGKRGSKPTRLPTTLPEPKSVQDSELRRHVEKLVASKAAIERAIDETPGDVMAHLSTTLSTLHQLEGYAARLVHRGEDIARFLRGVNLEALVEEVRVLTHRAQDASHPESRKTFEEAKKARMDELRTLKELVATKDSIDANLTRVVAVFGALPTKVVHMRALDAQALDRLSGDMNEELEAVGSELQTSEKVMKNLEVE